MQFAFCKLLDRKKEVIIKMITIKETYKNVGLVALTIFVMIMTGPATSWGRDLYVSPAGNDSVSYYNNGINNSWRSVLKAHQNAQAGDTVYFREGTYQISSTISTVSQGYHGTSASPIVFTSYKDEEVTWTSSIVGTVIRVGKNYHHYENLNCIHNPSSDTPGSSAFFRTGYEESSTGFRVHKCTFSMSKRGDNYGSIFLHGGCSEVEITHNKIVHTGTSGSTNSSGIIAFRVNKFKINNNVIIGPPMGIYLKHANSTDAGDVGGEVRNNFVMSTTRRAFFCNFNHILVENNIFHYDNTGTSEGVVQFNESNGVAGGDYNIIRNNTFMCGVFFCSDSGGAIHNVFEGNIICGSGHRLNIHPYSQITDYTKSDYNLYVAGACISRNNVNYNNLSTWKGTMNQDYHSLSGTPTFVGGAYPSTIAGYALAPGSIGKRAGLNGTDMGADITQVGIEGIDLSPISPPHDTAPPNTPTNVEIDVVY